MEQVVQSSSKRSFAGERPSRTVRAASGHKQKGFSFRGTSSVPVRYCITGRCSRVPVPCCALVCCTPAGRKEPCAELLRAGQRPCARATLPAPEPETGAQGRTTHDCGAAPLARPLGLTARPGARRSQRCPLTRAAVWISPSIEPSRWSHSGSARMPRAGTVAAAAVFFRSLSRDQPVRATKNKKETHAMGRGGAVR